MERGQVLVVGAAIAVVGAFVFKVVSDRTSLQDHVASERSIEAPGDVHPGGDGSARNGGTSRSASGESANRARTGLGASERGSTGRGADGSGGTVRRPGASAAGHLREHGTGSVARSEGEAVVNGSGTGPDVPSSQEQRRADVRDMLSQPSAQDDSATDPGNQEVALEVRSTDETEQASRSEEIDDPEDGNGIKFTDGSQLTFAQAGGATGEAGTISFEVEPDWHGGDATDNSFVQIRDENEWANRLQLVKNGRFLRFILADSTGREADISVPIDEWSPGEPHSVSASWGNGQTSLYIDGRLAGSNSYSGDFNISPTTPLHLGSDYRSSDYGGANATIRDFTLYKNAQHP